MDIEQLKLVLETVQQLGAQGKEAFIWWVVLDKVLPVLGWLITFAGLMTVVFWLIRAVQSANEDAARLEKLRDVLLDSAYPGVHVGEGAFKMMLEKLEKIKK